MMVGEQAQEMQQARWMPTTPFRVENLFRLDGVLVLCSHGRDTCCPGVAGVAVIELLTWPARLVAHVWTAEKQLVS